MIDYPAHFPTRSQLVTCFLAGFSCCVVAMVLFYTTIVSPGIFVIAVPWSVFIMSLEFSATFDAGLRTSIGTAVGAYLGLLAVVIERALTDQTALNHISTAFLFPFAVFLATADDIVGSPLGGILRSDMSFLGLYLVGSFASSQAEEAAWEISVSLAIGCAVAILVSGGFRLVCPHWGSVNRFSRNIDRFASRTAYLFEGLVAYLMSGPDHYDGILSRYKDLDAAVEKVYASKRSLDNSVWWQFSANNASELVECVTVIPSQLLALQHTLDEKYSDKVYQKLWSPLEPKFTETASAITRGLTSDIDLSPQASVSELCSELYSQLLVKVRELGRSESEVDPPDLMRFVFSMIALMRFARLTSRFVRLRAQLRAGKSHFSLYGPMRSLRSRIRALFSLKAWNESLRRDSMGGSVLGGLRYPIKLAIIQQVFVQGMIAWHNAGKEGIAMKAVWAALALIFCSVPTVGGSLAKGSRRILGTLIGGALGLLSVVMASNGNVLGYTLQLFLVCFVSKLLMFIRFFGYTGGVVALTWAIVAMASWGEPYDYSKDVSLAARRILLTVVGASAAPVLSMLILPRFGTLSYRKATASMVDTCTDFVTQAVRLVLNKKAVEEAQTPVGAADLIAAYQAGAMYASHKTLRKDNNLRTYLSEETRVEIFWADLMLCFQRQSNSMLPINEIISLKPRIERLKNAAMVVFATAAGTVVSENVQQIVNKHLQSDMEGIVGKIVSSKSGIIIALRYLGKRSLKHYSPSHHFTENLAAKYCEICTTLKQSDEYEEALSGGLLRVCAFLFTLEEFFQAWNGLANAIRAKRYQSSVPRDLAEKTSLGTNISI